MIKLKPIASTELSSYVVDLLAARAITTVRKFLSTDLDELAKITNLSREAVIKLRSQVIKKNATKGKSALSLYNELKLRRRVYGFGIESCDTLLGNQKFCSGSIFEIYGIAGIGKTQLCLTIIANILSNFSELDLLYVDTKNDFSGKRLMQILRARYIHNDSQTGNIMQRIKLEFPMSMRGVLNILQKLHRKIQENPEDVNDIKLIVIDALPAVWFIHNSDEDRFERNSLLYEIAEFMRRLSQQFSIAFLLVNIGVDWCDEMQLNIAERRNSQNENDSHPTSQGSSISDDGLIGISVKPTMSRYWAAIPQIQLLLKMPEGADENTSERILEVTRNCYGPVGINCRIDFTDFNGVVC